jgi:hypothetical protein
VRDFRFYEHCCSPCIRWHAFFHQEHELHLVETARLKLLNSPVFNDKDADQVLAVLSQRLSIDTVLVGSEAIKLADHSVANHMRLLTGISSDRRVLHTHSPSEPILVQAAAVILHREKQPWGPVLDTFSESLCSSGLVEKGLIGELGARTLLLVARDFTAPKQESDGLPDLLRPVLLLDLLDNLFGNKTWCGGDRGCFEHAFGGTFINFTHWIITKDALPVDPDQ